MFKNVVAGPNTAEIPVASTLQDLITTATADQRRELREMLEREDRAEAERLRNLAEETVRLARDALRGAIDRAAELESLAQDLDGRETHPKPTIMIGAPGSTESDYEPEDPDALADDLAPLELAASQSPKPKRTRKPKAEKPAKPARKPKRGRRVMAPKAPRQAKKPADLDDHDQKILKVASKGALGVAAIAEKCGLEQAYTARKCKKLVGLKRLIRHGAARATKYEAA